MTSEYRANSISLFAAVAMGTGVMIGAGILALTGQIAALAGPLFPLAFLAGALVTAFSAYTYVKMSNAYPSAGGIGMILEKAYGPTTVAAGAALLMALSMVINESLVARTFATYLLRGVGAETGGWLVPGLGVALIVLAYLVNVAGNRSVGILSILMAVLKVGGIALFGIAALWASGIRFEAAGSGADAGTLGFLASVALAILAFKGFTTITNSGAEITDPHRNVGRAIVISIAVCVVVYLLVAFAVGAALPLDRIVAAKDYALAFGGWMIEPWLVGAQGDLERAVFAGLSVLVMGYPCAVGISAPLAIVRGAARAAEKGILMRTGEAFQGYRMVRHVVLDKTGTLTEGNPAVRAIVASEDGNEDRVLAIAAAAEAASEHPLARAIVEAAFERELTPPDVHNFEAVPGKGVIAETDDGTVVVGKPDLLTDRGIEPDAALSARMTDLEAEGHTVIAVGQGRRILGAVALGDALRPDAREAVAALRSAGLGLSIVTGDSEGTARRIAATVGIDDVFAGVLPGEKAELVRRFQKDRRVAMVGDGINDAPALMQADIGIAMGKGTDIAIDSADIILLGTRLGALAEAHEISRGGYRKMLQNVSIAFLFNGIGVPLAATGLIYPVWAMTAMAVSVTAIFLNSIGDRPSIFVDAITSVGRPLDALPSSSRSTRNTQSCR